MRHAPWELFWLFAPWLQGIRGDRPCQIKRTVPFIGFVIDMGGDFPLSSSQGKDFSVDNAITNISCKEDAMEDIARILVVSRMTRYCQKAVHYGISLAKKYGAELSVIHVVHNLYGLEGWNVPMISIQNEFKKDMEKMKWELDEIIRKENDAGMAIKEIIREGNPTEEILRVVKEEKIDLMIMLAHEEGRLEHLLFSRSNEDLLRKMPCSILLVKKEPEVIKSFD